jgi:lysophospholipase L1-like esterase
VAGLHVPTGDAALTGRRSETTTTDPTGAATSLSPRRRRLFLALTLVLPWVLLALFELALRIVGYGNAYPLFVSVPDHPDYLVPNQEVAKRYFGDGPFVPKPQLDFFPARKAPRAFRIVFQGESSARGFPYGHGGAPSRMLEQRLQTAFPDRPIEVVNTALTAVNSYTLLDQADEIIAQRPDVVMIYTGHNEYYGAFGAGSPHVLRRRWMVRSYLVLRRLRVVQLLANALSRGTAAASASAPDDAPRTVMQLMAGDQLVPLGSRAYEDGLAQFRANLDALLARYVARGIPVLIGTVASNERDQRPFVGGPRAGADSTAWSGAWHASLAALQRGDSSGAERAATSATRADDTAADPFYLLATLHEAHGDFASAHDLYRAAKERDQLRFRAPEAVNQIIRQVAAARGAHVVETQRALERAAPHGIIGHTLMLEHLHPNVDGYFVVAGAFYDALRSQGLLGASSSATDTIQARARREVPVTAVDSIAGLLHADRLTSGWPFLPKGTERTPAVDTLHPRSVEEQLAQGLVLGRVSWPEAMDRLRARYEQARDLDDAVHVALVMAQEYRYSAQPLLDAARIEVGRHRYADALRYARAATERQETPRSVQLVGLLSLRQGDYATGLRYLERAARLAPGDQRIVVPLEAARALPALEQRRTSAPRDTTALQQLAVAYALTQQYERSREVLGALLRIAPRSSSARDLIRQLPADTSSAR